MELLKSLTRAAKRGVHRLPRRTRKRINIISADFFNVNLSNATFVFAHATAFSLSTIEALAKKADDELQPGSFFALTHHKLAPEHIGMMLVKEDVLDTDYFPTRVFVYQKCKMCAK